MNLQFYKVICLLLLRYVSEAKAAINTEKKLWFYKSAGAKTSSDLMIEEHAIIRVCVEKNSVCLLCALEFLVQDCVALGPDGHVDVWGWVIFWSGEREREKERKRERMERARVMWTELY